MVQIKILPSVVVITPTTLSRTIEDAINSVRAQTFKNIRHLIIVDGQKWWKMAERFDTADLFIDDHNIDFCVLPYNTGNVDGNKFYGHRVFAGFSHLTNADYILFLDEDNWFDPEHVQSLIDIHEYYNKLGTVLDFSYSLRKIYNIKREFICYDDCESLGKWPIYGEEPNGFLIDTSAYCFKRQFLEKYGHYWHSGWGGDRRFLDIVRNKYHASYDGSGQYTLNYRLHPDGVPAEFFQKGNDILKQKYTSGVFPWTIHPTKER